MNLLKYIFAFAILIFLSSCEKDQKTGKYQQTPYPLITPKGFPSMPIPANNPLTVEGVKLGKKLFFDKILSGDNSIACANCHAPENAFSDPNKFSLGINGSIGNRQSMPIQNLAWGSTFFWDGRVSSLEEQALKPVTNPIEMHETWRNASEEINLDKSYQQAFFKAFGTSRADSTLITRAIAQFMRTLISGNAKFDKWKRGEATLTPEELSGFDIYRDLNRGDCIHCHVENALFTDNSFQNNGMDLTLTDLGLGGVNGNVFDQGKFKVPSLRNLEFTAPYMHDGRFQTLEEVIDFYSEEVHAESPNISPLMEHKDKGGALLTAQEKSDLKAFLLTLSDPDFIYNPKHQAP